MICFCEDCGEKNRLAETSLKNGRVEFRCCSCQYPNSYSISGILKQQELQAPDLHPDIIGSFVYRGEKQPITNHMPESLTESDLETMGNCLTRNFLAAQVLYPDIIELAVAIGDKHITVQMLDADQFILVASTSLSLPSNIRSLLKKLTNMAAGENFPELFVKSSSMNDIKEHILLDHTGKIVAHDMEDPRGTAEMVSLSSRNMKSLGGTRFRYALFSRKQGDCMIVFPCASFCLGAVAKSRQPCMALSESLLSSLLPPLAIHQDPKIVR